MKHLSIFLTFALCVLFAASCNKQLQEDSELREVDVTLTLTADDIATKTFTDGDGRLAKVLDYVVYVQQGDVFVKTQVAGRVTVDTYPYALVLRLANSLTYRIACFSQSAAAAEAGLYNTSNMDAITISYDAILPNDDMGDAFCATKEFVATEGMMESVVMHRPLAQINVCAADLNEYNASAMDNQLNAVEMTFHDVPNAFGIVTGVADDAGYVPAHVLNSIQNKTYNAGILTYTRCISGVEIPELAMGYLLAEGAGNTMTVDLKFKAQDGTVINSVSVSNVPYRSNYRTNLYGYLVTNIMTFNIDLSPIFYDPDYNVVY